MAAKMKKCKHCGAEIAKSAKICPKCGGKNKKSALPLIIVLIVLILLLVIAGGGSGDSNKSSTGASKIGTVGSSTASQEETGSETDNEDTGSKSDTTEKTDVEIKDDYYVGDILSAKGMEMTYVASGEFTSSNQFSQPADGNKFIFIELFAENKSDSDMSISMFSFEAYADGYAIDRYYGGDEDLSASLSPGRTTSGRVYFEVPENAGEIEVEYEVDWLSSKKIRFIYEGNKDSGFTPEKNTTPTEGAFSVGDIVETNNLKISYLSCGTFESDNMFITPADGYKYIYCEFEFENISNSDTTVSSMAGFYCYADGNSCDGTYSRDDDISATLSAGRKTKGTVAFEVPVDAEVIEIEYLTNYWTSNRIVFSYSE